ncbi:precorrin-8X methylmutase [Synechococcus sp. Nb3U1]|uniref:precorrin-8X methylmutase n=1 Tax=Synechococcus sp. Nb3U1 TaxID=1914529 RepID=UPI002E23FE4A
MTQHDSATGSTPQRQLGMVMDEASVDPITAASFRQIDQEIGPHPWQGIQYEVVRRAIHATADFELRDRFVFSSNAIEQALVALREKRPVIVDVNMVAAGIHSRLVAAGIPLHCALDWVEEPRLSGQTRTANGMLNLAQLYPEALFVIGNAPTALLALVDEIQAERVQPCVVIGVPVGFVAVEAAKQALAQTNVPQIRVEGRKGGSPVAAAIVNALLTAAQRDPTSN